jgi:hypothetical protein
MKAPNWRPRIAIPQPNDQHTVIDPRQKHRKIKIFGTGRWNWFVESGESASPLE